MSLFVTRRFGWFAGGCMFDKTIDNLGHFVDCRRRQHFRSNERRVFRFCKRVQVQAFRDGSPNCEKALAAVTRISTTWSWGLASISTGMWIDDQFIDFSSNNTSIKCSNDADGCLSVVYRWCSGDRDGDDFTLPRIPSKQHPLSQALRSPNSHSGKGIFQYRIKWMSQRIGRRDENLRGHMLVISDKFQTRQPRQ